MSRDEAVLNDFSCDQQMVLLTGPNMGGKSTVLRAVCSTAVLANCGMMVQYSLYTVLYSLLSLGAAGAVCAGECASIRCVYAEGSGE
jgi:hypothetical protein